MANVAARAAAKTVDRLTSPGGLNDNIAAVAELEQTPLSELAVHQIIPLHVAPEVIEQAFAVHYPAVHVYVERVSNLLREKFRTFSGKAHVVIETRVTQDRLEGIERRLQLYVDAVTRVLDQRRGDWGDGMFYTGGYEVELGPVKHGGRNFIQSAKVTYEIETSLE